MSTPALPFVTEQEYLEQERRSTQTGCYFRGRVYPMEAASPSHSQIVANLIYALTPQARKRGCKVFATGLLVRVSATGLYTHPDIAILCAEPQYADSARYTVLNPTMIIEVASPSTRDYDSGGKFKHYKTIPSLIEYLTVAQDAPEVDQHLQQSENAWLVQTLQGINHKFTVESLGLELPFTAIYEDVEFPPEKP